MLHVRVPHAFAPALALAVFAGCAGGTSQDVKADPCTEVAPTVIASADATQVNPGTVVHLSATVGQDPAGCTLPAGDVRYLWELTVRPDGSNTVLSDPSSQTPLFTPDRSGAYQLQLTAIDSDGTASAPAFLTVSVGACDLLAPVVQSIGVDESSLDAPVGLSAAVADSNCVAHGAPTYDWALVAKPAGSSAFFSDPHSATPQVYADVGGDYQVRVVVTNSAHLSSEPFYATFHAGTCGMLAPVITAPSGTSSPFTFSIANPLQGQTTTIALLNNAVVNPNAACSTANQAPYTITWTRVNAPADSRATVPPEGWSAQFTPDVAGGHWRFAVTATSRLGLQSQPAYVDVIASPCGAQVPYASGFSASQVVNGTLISSTGGASQPLDANFPVQFSVRVVDPDDDATCGMAQSSSQHWWISAAPSGSAASIRDADSNLPTFTPDLPGTYQLSLLLTDDTGLSSTQSFPVAVGACGSHPPQIVSFGAGSVSPSPAIQLDATITDADSNPSLCSPAIPSTLTYLWRLSDLPLGSQAHLNDPTLAKPSFTPDVGGTYGVSLTVTDAQGVSTTGGFGIITQ